MPSGKSAASSPLICHTHTWKVLNGVGHRWGWREFPKEKQFLSQKKCVCVCVLFSGFSPRPFQQRKEKKNEKKKTDKKNRKKSGSKKSPDRPPRQKKKKLKKKALFSSFSRTRAHNCNLLEKWAISLRPCLHRPRPELPDTKR